MAHSKRAGDYQTNGQVTDIKYWQHANLNNQQAFIFGLALSAQKVVADVESSTSEPRYHSTQGATA